MSINEKMRADLLAMECEDQRVLQELKDSGELGADDYHPRMKDVHKKNMSGLKRIFGKHGWPGISMVGKDGSKAAWLIVQHCVGNSQFMTSGLALLKQAVTDGEAEGWCLAYLQDRVLTMAGQPQVYGTQHQTDENGIVRPLPISDEGRVDWLREGLDMEPLAQVTQKLQQDQDKIRANRDKLTGGAKK